MDILDLKGKHDKWDYFTYILFLTPTVRCFCIARREMPR